MNCWRAVAVGAAISALAAPALAQTQTTHEVVPEFVTFGDLSHRLKLEKAAVNGLMGDVRCEFSIVDGRRGVHAKKVTFKENGKQLTTRVVPFQLGASCLESPKETDDIACLIETLKTETVTCTSGNVTFQLKRPLYKPRKNSSFAPAVTVGAPEILLPGSLWPLTETVRSATCTLSDKLAPCTWERIDAHRWFLGSASAQDLPSGRSELVAKLKTADLKNVIEIKVHVESCTHAMVAEIGLVPSASQQIVAFDSSCPLANPGYLETPSGERVELRSLRRTEGGRSLFALLGLPANLTPGRWKLRSVSGIHRGDVLVHVDSSLATASHVIRYVDEALNRRSGGVAARDPDGGTVAVVDPTGAGKDALLNDFRFTLPRLLAESSKEWCLRIEKAHVSTPSSRSKQLDQLKAEVASAEKAVKSAEATYTLKQRAAQEAELKATGTADKLEALKAAWSARETAAEAVHDADRAFERARARKRYVAEGWFRLVDPVVSVRVRTGDRAVRATLRLASNASECGVAPENRYLEVAMVLAVTSRQESIPLPIRKPFKLACGRHTARAGELIAPSNKDLRKCELEYNAEPYSSVHGPQQVVVELTIDGAAPEVFMWTLDEGATTFPLRPLIEGKVPPSEIRVRAYISATDRAVHYRPNQVDRIEGASLVRDPNFTFDAEIRPRGRFAFSGDLVNGHWYSFLQDFRLYVTVPVSVAGIRLPPNAGRLTRSDDKHSIQATGLRTGLLLAVEPWSWKARANPLTLPLKGVIGAFLLDGDDFDPFFAVGIAATLPLVESPTQFGTSLSVSFLYERELAREGGGRHFFIALSAEIFSLLSPKVR